MSLDGMQQPRSPLAMLARKDVLAGLMFVGVALLGLWLSRNYPIGTALRMGTGYVPRLLCWILLGLGLVVLAQGLRASQTLGGDHLHWRPILLVPTSLLVFALTINRFGVVIAALLLIGIASLAGRDLRALEVVIAAIVLVGITLAIFVWGLGLPIPVWPDFW
jgi:putative tricarboxylic transport membrane protein